MKKEKVTYHFVRYEGKKVNARREISYEMQLAARLILDEICFRWNKSKLLEEIDLSFDQGDKEKFLYLSGEYQQYVWE